MPRIGEALADEMPAEEALADDASPPTGADADPTDRSGSSSERGDLARLLPEDALWTLEFDAPRLAAACRASFPGRVAAHPSWGPVLRGATGDLTGGLRRIAARIQDATGEPWPRLASVVNGRVAVCVRSWIPGSWLELAVLVEAKERLAKLESLAARLAEVAAEDVASGGAPTERVVDGARVVVSPSRWGPIYRARVSGCVAVATSLDLLRDVLRRGASAREAASAPGAAAAGPSLRMSVDVARARSVVVPALRTMAELDTKGVQRALAALGVDALESIAIEWTPADDPDLDPGRPAAGLFELRLRRREAAGFLDVLGDALEPVKDPWPALALLPANASRVASCRLALGPALETADGVLRRAVPELGDALDDGWRALVDALGVESRAAVVSAPPLELTCFEVPRPLSGGWGVDGFVLVRRDALEPWWRGVEFVGRSAGVEAELVASAGGAVEWIDFASAPVVRGAVSRLLGNVVATEEGELASAWIDGVASPIAGAARLDLDDDWALLSTRPRPLVRWSTMGAEGPRIERGTPFARHVENTITGSRLGLAWRDASGPLRVYAALLPYADAFGGVLRGAGIEVEHLPPAEVFRDAGRRGGVRLDMARDEVVLRARDPLLAHPWVALVTAGAAVTLRVAAEPLLDPER